MTHPFFGPTDLQAAYDVYSRYGSRNETIETITRQCILVGYPVGKSWVYRDIEWIARYIEDDISDMPLAYRVNYVDLIGTMVEEFGENLVSISFDHSEGYHMQAAFKHPQNPDGPVLLAYYAVNPGVNNSIDKESFLLHHTLKGGDMLIPGIEFDSLRSLLDAIKGLKNELL